MEQELEPGQRVEAKASPFKGRRGTLSHKSGKKYVVILDGIQAGTNVLRWPAKRFRVLAPDEEK